MASASETARDSSPGWHSRSRLPRTLFQSARRRQQARDPNRRLLGDEVGSVTLLELAWTLPVVFMFLIGLTELCRLFYTYEMISECAREGTRYAAVHGSTCVTSAGSSCEVSASQVNTYVLGLGYPNVGGGTVSVNTTYPDGAETPPDRVQVTVTYTFPYSIPYMPSQNLSLSSSSEMYIIQ